MGVTWHRHSSISQICKYVYLVIHKKFKIIFFQIPGHQLNSCHAWFKIYDLRSALSDSQEQ